MKRKITVVDKVSIFMKWIRNLDGFGLIGSCDLCQSSKLRRVDHQTKQVGGSIEYSAIYECLNCGGSAKAVEIWKKCDEVR